MADIRHTILKHKPAVDDAIRTYLKRREATLINPRGITSDLLQRLAVYATGGKSVRGSLLVYGFRLFAKTIPDYVITAAAAIEFFHSGFLIHDDIFDGDTMRRGNPAMHVQYASGKAPAVSGHYGVSMAINAGDACFLFGMELLMASVTSSMKGLNNHILDIYQSVIAGQMADVSQAYGSAPSTDDIITVYTSKTARYTFSLPLAAGAALAGAAQTTVVCMEKLGESLGILYQIRDDELNAFGDSSVTGKTVGTDLTSGKYTLARSMDRDQLKAFVRNQQQQATRYIAELPVRDTNKEELRELLYFCTNRTA